MASTIEATLILKHNGAYILGSPLKLRLTVDEAQEFRHEEADGGGYVALPTSEMAEIQVLAVKPDQQVTIRLDGQSDKGIVLNAGGLLLIFDADIDAGASTNATVDNSSGSTVNLEGIAGGT
jgi:hypothetical protein